MATEVASVDVLIVGFGWTGAIAAMELANEGLEVLALERGAMQDTPILPIEDVTSSYYLRLRVADVTGVLANITRILADKRISIDALLQKESEQVDGVDKGETDIILITHETVERNVNAAIREIEALSTVVSQVTKLRMEALN